jgi:hypothetical protein
MVKPESQARQPNHRIHPVDALRPVGHRKLNAKTELDPSDSFNSHSPVAVEPPSESVVELIAQASAINQQPTPEEIENAFLKCYSEFLGTELNQKTTWKSETFNQVKSDRTQNP